MGKLIYDGLSVIFSGGGLNDFTTILDTLYRAMRAILVESELAGSLYTSMVAIAACLLLIYFGMDTLGQIQRDMFSLEKLVLAYIKLIIALILLMYLKDILVKSIEIGYKLENMATAYVSTAQGDRRNALNNAMNSYTFDFSAGTNLEPVDNDRKDTNPYASVIPKGKGDGSGIDKGKWPKWEEVNGVFDKHYGKVDSIITHFGLVIMCLFFILIGFAKKMFTYFYLIGASVNVITRALFAPIAVVNCFEGESRSQGIRYIKHFIAGLIQFALIIVIVAACDWMSAKILTSEMTGKTISLVNLDSTINIGMSAKLIVAQAASIGAMTKSSDIAGDIMGTKPT